MTQLSNLVPLSKKRKRVGRGGSRGGTAGKGHKGQKARSGPKIGSNFEGGQMPLTRRLPKRGFSNARFKVTYELVSLEQLNNAFDTGTVVTRTALEEKNIVKPGKELIKILANGTLEKKLIVHAHAFSKTAAEHIQAKGGEVHKVQER
jgi:large subunit ribosomal protein L15